MRSVAGDDDVRARVIWMCTDRKDRNSKNDPAVRAVAAVSFHWAHGAARDAGGPRRGVRAWVSYRAGPQPIHGCHGRRVCDVPQPAQPHCRRRCARSSARVRLSATPPALSAIPITASGVVVGMPCSTFRSVATRRTDGPQTNACRHCGSHITHWFTPPEASDEGAILLCGRCSRVTTILVANGGIVRAWPSRPAGHAA